MCNLLAHHIKYHQASKLIDAFLGLPLVEPERRAAIGARLNEMSLAAGLEERRLEQRCDGRSSLYPDRKRRHCEPGILSQQRHESRDVGLIPQGHIAVKQCLYLGARTGMRDFTSDMALLQSASG